MPQTPAATLESNGGAERLWADLRGRILSGALAPGSALDTQVELGQVYGIPASTAALALRRLAEESLIVRTRRKGSYVCDKLPAAARTITALAAAVSSQPDVEGLRESPVQWLSRGCRQRGWEVQWHHLALEEMADLDALVERYANATPVLVHRSVNVELPLRLSRRAVPVVMLFDALLSKHGMHATPFARVTLDRRRIGLEAARYLRGRGHRNILFCGYRNAVDTLLRLDGWLEGMDGAGADLAVPRTLFVPETLTGVADFASRIRKVLKSDARPTAVCCAYARLARIVEELALGMGLRIPADLSLVSCQDGGDAESAPIPITAIGVLRDEMCERVTALFERMMSLNGQIVQWEPALLPIHCVERNSCARLGKPRGVRR